MSRILSLFSWLAFPVYVWQGVGLRLRTQRLLPAQGPLRGQIEGSEPVVRLLVVGDSSAASVGIARTENGLAAQLARMIADRPGRSVIWRAAGFNSAADNHVRDFVVPNLKEDDWTHIVISIGTNDTKNFHSAPRFKKDFGGLLYVMRARWPNAKIVWSPVIELSKAPAMPGALGAILDIRAETINRMGIRLCSERGAIAAPRLPVLDPKAGFCSDGFHASDAGYHAWAQHLAPILLNDQPKAC